MISGKRAHLTMIAAFSVESGSAGSPSVRQPAVIEASVSRSIGLKPSVEGILRSTMSGIHLPAHRSLRKVALKGAMYAMKEEETITSPTSTRSLSSSCATFSVQRTPSSLRPLTSRVARLARICVFSALATSSFFSLVESSSCLASSALRSSSDCTCARTAASFLLAW